MIALELYYSGFCLASVLVARALGDMASTGRENTLATVKWWKFSVKIFRR